MSMSYRLLASLGFFYDPALTRGHAPDQVIKGPVLSTRDPPYGSNDNLHFSNPFQH